MTTAAPTPEEMLAADKAFTPPSAAEMEQADREFTQRKPTAIDRARAKALGKFSDPEKYKEKYGQLGPQRNIPGVYDASGPVPSVDQGYFTEGGVGSGMFQAGADIGSVIARVLPIGATGDDLQRVARDVDAARQAAGEGMVERGVRGIARSVMPMALTGRAGLVPTIATGAAIQGSQSLTEARDQGLSEPEARAFAARAAATEAISELLFARFLPTAEKVISGGVKPTIGNLRGLIGEIARTAASEYGQEAGTEYLHSANEWLSNISPEQHEWTPEGWVTLAQRMNQAGVQGAIIGGGLSAANAGITAAEQMAERLDRLREVRAKGYVSAEDGQKAGIQGETRKERLANADAEITQLEQEIQNASAVPSPEAEVRQPEGGEDVRGQGQVEVQPEPAGEVTQVRVEPQQEPAAPDKGMLGGMGGAVVDNFYDAILKSIQDKGEVPGPERKSSVGRAWDRVRDTMPPEEFVQRLRQEGPDALQKPVDERQAMLDALGAAEAAAPEQPQVSAEPEKRPVRKDQKTRMDLILDEVERSGQEMTVRLEGATPDVLDRAIQTASDRGLWATTDGHNLLIKPKPQESAAPEAEQPKRDVAAEIRTALTQGPVTVSTPRVKSGFKVIKVLDDGRVKTSRGVALTPDETWVINPPKPVEATAPQQAPAVEKPVIKPPHEMTAEEWESQPKFIPAQTRTVKIDDEIRRIQSLPPSLENGLEKTILLPDLKAAKAKGQATFEEPIGEPPPGYNTGALGEVRGFVRKSYKQVVREASKTVKSPPVPPQEVAEPPPAVEKPPESREHVVTFEKLGLKKTATGRPRPTPLIKELANTTAEFRYDPTLVADKNGNLVFRDGYKFTFKPEQFGLGEQRVGVDETGKGTYEKQVNPGDVVRVDLASMGVKQATESDVVTEALEAQGFSNVKTAKDGKRVTASWKGKNVEVGQIGKHDWYAVAGKASEAVIGDDGGQRANETLARIRWTQPGDQNAGPSKGKLGPSIGTETTADSPKISPPPQGPATWMEKITVPTSGAIKDRIAQAKKDKPFAVVAVEEVKDGRTTYTFHGDESTGSGSHTVEQFVEVMQRINRDGREVVIAAERVSEKRPKPKKAKTKLAAAADQAVQEAQDELDSFGKMLKGKGLASNPMLDPEVIAGAGRVVAKFVKAGTLKFAALVEHVAKSIGQAAVGRIRPALEAEWDRLQKIGSMTYEEFSKPESQFPPAKEGTIRVYHSTSASGDSIAKDGIKTGAERGGTAENAPVVFGTTSPNVGFGDNVVVFDVPLKDAVVVGREVRVARSIKPNEIRGSLKLSDTQRSAIKYRWDDARKRVEYADYVSGSLGMEPRTPENQAEEPPVSSDDLTSIKKEAAKESAAEAAQREAEEARPDVQAEGFFGGGRFKGERVRDDQIPDAIQAPKEQENRLQKARGMQKPSLLERIKESLTHLKNVTRAQEFLPDTPENAAANEFFRLQKNVPAMSQDEAVRTAASVVDPLGPKQMHLFERYAIMGNQAASIKLGQPLRFGFKSAEDVEAYQAKIQKVVDLVPAVKEAIETRKKIVQEKVDKLVEYDLLPESARENAETYYHQQVHFYALARMKGGGTRVGKTDRSFQRARVEGEALTAEEMDYNTSYLESEISWLTDANMEIEKERLFRELMDKEDIKSDLQKKAEKGQRWQDLIPDGYEVFQPEPGNHFYRAFTLPEKIVEQLQENVLATAELTAEDLRQVLALAGPKRQFVVRSELAAQLTATKKGQAPHGLGKLADEAMRMWKAWTLLNPKRALAYNLRNITGDLDPVVASDPSLLRQTGRALQELANYHKGRLQISPELRAARDHGVIGSGFVAEEVPDIKDLAVFRRFIGSAGRSKFHPLSVIQGYMNIIKPFTNWREDVLRYSAFLGYRDQLRQGRVKHYGGAKKAVVDQIKKDLGVDAAAAHLARNLLGDYGNISVAGNWIRRRLAPFWSFQEINLKRVPRLAVNAWESGGTMRTAGTLSAAAGRAILMSRIAWMYGALWVWNRLIQGGDEEDELTGPDRAVPHVILGRNPDGSIRVFRRVGALGDFMEWFGINEAIAMLGKYKAGQVDASDILKEMAFATPEKAMNSLRPDLKAVYEIPTGQSLFPEPFQPRSVRRDEATAVIVGLEDEYKWMKGWAIRDGSSARPHYWQRWLYGVADPRQSALSEIYDLRSAFLKKKGKEEKGVFPVSRYKEARDAAKSEDYGAFTDWKRNFVTDRGEKATGDFKDWLGTLDPTSSRLNDADELEFETEFLSKEQRGRLAVARNYSHELRDLLVTWWDADEKSKVMKRAVLFSAFERMDMSKPKRKDYKSDDKYQAAITRFTNDNARSAKEIKAMANSLEEAAAMLKDYYKTNEHGLRVKGTNKLKPGYVDRLNELKRLYAE